MWRIWILYAYSSRIKFTPPARGMRKSFSFVCQPCRKKPRPETMPKNHGKALLWLNRQAQRQIKQEKRNPKCTELFVFPSDTFFTGLIFDSAQGPDVLHENLSWSQNNANIRDAFVQQSTKCGERGKARVLTTVGADPQLWCQRLLQKEHLRFEPMTVCACVFKTRRQRLQSSPSKFNTDTPK